MRGGGTAAGGWFGGSVKRQGKEGMLASGRARKVCTLPVE